MGMYVCVCMCEICLTENKLYMFGCFRFTSNNHSRRLSRVKV